MKKLKQTLIYLLPLLFVMNVQIYSQSRKAIGKIFSSEIESKLSIEQMKYFRHEKNKIASKKVELFRLMTTQSELKNVASISFDIFGEEVSFDIKEIITNRDKSISLIGLTDRYELFLTVEGDDITASISIDNKTYAIVPLGEGMHSLIEIDLSKYKQEEEPLIDKNFEKEENSLQKGEQILTSSSDVDILVAYTHAANSAVSNMSTLINNVISQINSSFSEGGINVAYHLVHSTEINIVEGSKSSSAILNEFDSNSIIASLRNQFRADLCFLITNSNNVSGIAWRPWDPNSGTSYLGFAIGNYDYVRDNKTFSHETGHNFGAAHNIEETSYLGYKHGYLNASADFCTIMSYPSTNFSQRKNIWSDPNNTWNGHTRGVVDTSENVRWLNEQRGDIESYRTFQTTGTISSAHHWRRNITLTGNVYVNAELTIEDNCNVNLNGHFVKVIGGSIIQESGSTITGLKAYLMYSSTLKGFFPSVSSAISNASSNQQVELLANTTYSENISISNKSNVDLIGASNGTSIINGNITVTNSNYSDAIYVKMDNGHKITINGGYHSDISNVNYINTSDAVYFYNGYLNDLWHTNINSGGGQAPACKFYNTTSDVGGLNINDGYDFAVYATNNASLTIGTASYFCNNMFDLYATSGGYIYAYNNTMSAPWPMSVAGNVSGSSPYSCYQQMAKSSSLSNEGNPLSDELKAINVEYTELSHTISAENEEKSPAVMDNYKTDFDALIVDYKALLNEKSEAVEVTGILSKIEKCYYATEDEDDFEAYIKTLLSDKSYVDVYPYIERYYANLHISREEYKEAIEVCENVLSSKGINEALTCEMLYEEGLIYKYSLDDTDAALKLFTEIVEKYPKNSLSSFAKNELEVEGLAIPENKADESIIAGNSANFIIDSYPNPFNPSTTLSYSLPSASNVKLDIYDVMGRLTKSFATNSQSKGTHKVVWDGTNSNGVKVSTGIYIYRFEATSLETNEHFVKSEKLMLVK